MNSLFSPRQIKLASVANEIMIPIEIDSIFDHSNSSFQAGAFDGVRKLELELE